MGPFFWIVTTSLKGNEDFFAYPPVWLPPDPSLKHYAALFTRSSGARYFANSMVISSLSMVTPIGHEVSGGRLYVVDAEREVVEAALPQIRRCKPVSFPGVGSNSSSWISKRGSAPSSTRVMCCAFMPGMPMYRAGGPPLIVKTCSLRKPSSAKKSIAGPASATAMVT